MSQFLTPLCFQDSDGFPFVLTAPLAYQSDVAQRWIRVPVGFATDLASIPRVLWNVLPPVGKYDKAAVIHDFLYQQNGLTRRTADAVLNEAMTVLGVGRFTRWMIWGGVRVGGWKPWNAYRAKELPPS